MLDDLLDLIEDTLSRLIEAVRRLLGLSRRARKGPERPDLVGEYPDERPIETGMRGALHAEDDFSLGAFFDDPHASVAGMQRKTADAILGSVGAPYLPSRLLQLLKRHDAFRAADIFLGSLGFNYGLLLRNGRERVRLERVTLILVEVDALLRDSRLNDAPLYRLIATRPDEDVLEAYVERLRKVAGIVRALMSDWIVFAEYKTDFLPKAWAATEHWELADDEVISDLYGKFLEWRGLQDQYERVNSEINGLVREIHGHGPEIEERLARIVRMVERIRGETVGGMLTAAESLKELYVKLAELRRVYESIPRRGRAGSPPPDGDAGTPRGRPKGGDSAEAFLRVLGLNFPTDLDRIVIKQAYRKLLFHSHPDYGGTTQKFMEVQGAYGWLMDYLDGKGTAHEQKV